MMSNPVPTVHLIDDDEAILKSLTLLLGAGGYHVEAHGCAEDFLERHDPHAPGCAIIELGLPGMDGFGVQAALGSGEMGYPVIFLTGCGDIAACARAIKAGAVDFLTRSVDAACLMAAVSLALEQGANMRKAGEERLKAERRLASLTPREREVLARVIAGRLNKQIAAELGTVEKTVKVHRGRMMEKMGVRNVADLVRVAAIVQAGVPAPEALPEKMRSGFASG